MKLKSSTPTPTALPDGFRNLKGDLGAPFWRPLGATPVQGEYLGKFIGTLGPYYQLKLTAPCSWKTEGGKAVQTAEPGTVISLPDKAALHVLDPLAPGAVVCILVEGKVKTRKGNDVWNMLVGVQG